MKFRKKPVVIEAYKYQAELGNNRLMNWLAQQGATVKDWLFFDGEITIPTLEGKMKAIDGDWIIRGVKGEFYPCKPDIFAATADLALAHEEQEKPQITRRLVEAAPNLLEACIRLLPHAVAARYEEHPDILFAADAIAKAEGRGSISAL